VDVLFYILGQVGWDESSAGERQQRVSIWDIEPLTTPFLLCPPPLALRPKRTRESRGKVHDSGVNTTNINDRYLGVMAYIVGTATSFSC